MVGLTSIINRFELIKQRKKQVHNELLVVPHPRIYLKIFPNVTKPKAEFSAYSSSMSIT